MHRLIVQVLIFCELITWKLIFMGPYVTTGGRAIELELEHQRLFIHVDWQRNHDTWILVLINFLAYASLLTCCFLYKKSTYTMLFFYISFFLRKTKDCGIFFVLFQNWRLFLMTCLTFIFVEYPRFVFMDFKLNLFCISDIAGLEVFNSDKSKCQEHFDIYKECRKKEVQSSV